MATALAQRPLHLIPNPEAWTPGVPVVPCPKCGCHTHNLTWHRIDEDGEISVLMVAFCDKPRCGGFRVIGGDQ